MLLLISLRTNSFNFYRNISFTVFIFPYSLQVIAFLFTSIFFSFFRKSFHLICSVLLNTHKTLICQEVLCSQWICLDCNLNAFTTVGYDCWVHCMQYAVERVNKEKLSVSVVTFDILPRHHSAFRSLYKLCLYIYIYVCAPCNERVLSISFFFFFCCWWTFVNANANTNCEWKW